MSRDAVVINVENGVNYDLTILIAPFEKQAGVINRSYSPVIIGSALGGLPARLRGTIQPGDRIILTSHHIVSEKTTLLTQGHLEELADHFSSAYGGAEVSAYSSKVIADQHKL
jgi:hypothetical protein